jgi:hypothetical protein
LSASDDRPVNDERVHEPARVYRIAPCALRASTVPLPCVRPGVKASATSRFIWGALASAAASREGLRGLDGRHRD